MNMHITTLYMMCIRLHGYIHIWHTQTRQSTGNPVKQATKEAISNQQSAQQAIKKQGVLHPTPHLHADVTEEEKKGRNKERKKERKKNEKKEYTGYQFYSTSDVDIQWTLTDPDTDRP